MKHLKIILLMMMCSLILQVQVFSHKDDKKVEPTNNTKIEENENSTKIKNSDKQENIENSQNSENNDKIASSHHLKKEGSHTSQNSNSYMIPYVLAADVLVIICGIIVVILERRKYFNANI